MSTLSRMSWSFLVPFQDESSCQYINIVQIESTQNVSRSQIMLKEDLKAMEYRLLLNASVMVFVFLEFIKKLRFFKYLVFVIIGIG